MSSKTKKKTTNQPQLTGAAKVLADREAKREAEFEKEERIQAKLQELDDKKAELEADYQAKETTLKEDFKKKEEDLIERENRVKNREDSASEQEKLLDELKDSIRQETIDEVKKSEQEIRASEYESLKASWAEEELENKAKLQEDLVAAHDARIAAETAKLEKLREADVEIEARFKSVSEDYQKKLTELQDRITEYKRLQADIELEKADLSADRDYVKTLKEKYSTFSESKVLELESKIVVLESDIKVKQERLSELSEKLARYTTRTITSAGQSDQERIDELEHSLDEAVRQLDEYVNMPSPERIAELELHETELIACKEESEEVHRQLSKAQEQLSAIALSSRELENTKATANALEALNDQLQKKLNYISEQYKNSQENKFQGLLEIDAEGAASISERASFNGSLTDLVKYVRNYGASSDRVNPLYYSEDTIRVFISSLAASEPASRLIILQGLSGTGKSSLPALFADALDFHVDFISVQPSWRDNRELLGYDNDFTNRFKETEFTKSLYHASTGPEQNHVTIIVLDEMNLARIEYYFADFLSVLEHRDTVWKVPLISSYSEPDSANRPKYLNYDNGTANIMVTKNIWFVGTANNDDSTSLITDKVYDRAQIIDMDKREDPFTANVKNPYYLDASYMMELFNGAKKNKANRMSDIDWKTLNELDQDYLKPMDITFGNRIKNQLADFVPVYVACGGTKEGAIDYFLAHKILRKLDEKYDAYLLKCLDDLKEALDALYTPDSFKQSFNKINQIKHRNFNAGEI